jgi:hypothetical protein
MTTPTVTIEPSSAAAGTLDPSGIDVLLERVRAEHPDVKITVNPTPEDALRDATRRYAPEVADALDAGDVQGAAELFVARLEARMVSTS